MHYNISGTNITVDKTIDPTIVKHIGTELPNIDVYMRSCPFSVNLEYEGGRFPYGDIVSERLGSGALIYHIALKRILVVIKELWYLKSRMRLTFHNLRVNSL